MKRNNSLSGKELKQLLSQLRDAANRHLGMTNYIHLNDLNLADDGTFSVVIKKSPAGEPRHVSEREILDHYEDIEEIEVWEQELFWSWNKRYMTLRASAQCVTKDGNPESVNLTIDDKAEDMKEWKGSYIQELSNRDSVVEKQDGSSEDTVFGGDSYEWRQSEDDSLDDAKHQEDIDEHTGDELSSYLTEIYSIWFHGENIMPMKDYFEEPRKERAYDVKQTVEIDRIKYHAHRMTEVLNDLSGPRGNGFDSAIIRNKTHKVQELHSAYTSLDNEIRPNSRNREFQETWTRFNELFRSTFSRIQEI